MNGRSRVAAASTGRPPESRKASEERSRTHTDGVDASLVRWFAFDPALAAAAQPIHLIVEKIGRSLAADCAFVGEPLETAPKTARTIACWRRGHLVDSVVYPTKGSPYHEVKRSSLVVQALRGLDGALLGHLGVASRKRFTNDREVRRVLAICAPRVAGVVERLRREKAAAHPPPSALVGGTPRERELLASLREGETLLREVYHRVKNNLQVVASLLTMQADAANDAAVRKALSDAASRIATIALIHAQLCEAPRGASVDMRAFLHALVANLRRTFADSTTDVVTLLDIDPIDLPLHLATPCGLLVSELVTNAFQHAFQHPDHGVIRVRLSSNGVVTLAVRDNGPGLPRDIQRGGSKGMGLRLVRLLATRQLRGRLSISGRRGTQVIVRFASLVRPSRGRRAWKAE